MRRYVVGLTAALVVAGLWTAVVPDGISNAQSGCPSQDAVSPTEAALASDCEVLLSIRDTLAGTATLNWAADVPITDWNGISVGGTPTRVVRISLVDSRLTGTIPPQLGNLSVLTGLDLSQNDLTGNIPPELGNLGELTELFLDKNLLSGELPRSFTNLTELTSFFFSDNGGLCAPTDDEFRSWLQGMSNSYGRQCESEADRAVLVSLYNATDGGNWVDSSNWLSDRTMGEWHGVSIDDEGHVTQLELIRNQLSGEIPIELGNLANLTTLVLYGNQLSGEIPTELGNLANLTTLDLYGNQLSGTIPHQLADLINLTYLHLGGNGLSGEIPLELGDLINLTRLDLGSNQLSGEIPHQLADLINLSILDLSENELSGEIPPELGDLTSLEWLLGLGSNQLSGEIPSELSNLRNLRILYLSGNQLIGEIPPELGDLPKMQSLYLHDNQLSGKVPSELGNLSNLAWLRLAGNQLTGEFPDSFTGLPRMFWLDFFSNAGLCAPVEDAFQAWLQSIDYLHGSSCAPMDSQEDRAVLIQFYKSTDGVNWKNKSNWLSDRPIREWYGVANDAKGRVTGLYHRGNQLGGSIPPELGNLSELMALYLSYNRLTGPIPPELGNLSKLKGLYLHVNQLTGSIPLELINLSDLRSLYLSYNQLTGCIPAPLQHFNDLDYLGLSICVIPGVTMSIDPESQRVRIESPIPVTVRFSEPVNGFVASDVTVANGDVSNFSGSDGDRVYTFDLSPNAVGVVTVDINADVAGDPDGYANTPAAQLIVGLPYDDDHDGAISRSEILEAVADYLDGRLSAQHILVLVSLYFQFPG